MSRKRVEFRTYHGVTLRGDYYAVSEAHAPLLIMTQGLTLLKEHHIDITTKRFQVVGIACLVYDHRSWGSSEGTPHQEWNPLQFALDYADAVSFARTLDGIDPERRTGIWGIGHSGGTAIIAAAHDPRVKAAVFNMPWTSGQADAKTFPEAWRDVVMKDREEHSTMPNHSRRYVQVWDGGILQAQDPNAEDSATGLRPVLHGVVPHKFISGARPRSDAAGTPWENRMTAQSLLHIARAEPEDYMGKVKSKFLYIAAEKDELTGTLESHRRVFGKGKGELGKMEVVGKTHLGNYPNTNVADGWKDGVKMQIEWLMKNL